MTLALPVLASKTFEVNSLAMDMVLSLLPPSTIISSSLPDK
jgi:hypothetical protein